MGRKGQARVLLLVGVGALLAGAATGWHFRDRLRGLLPDAVRPAATDTAEAASRPVPQDHPDVLYTWVDANGVTHFEQEPARNKGAAETVVYDGRRITPLAPVDPTQIERIREATAGLPDGPGGDAGAGAPAKDKGLLGNLREEMAEGVRDLKARRDAQREAQHDL